MYKEKWRMTQTKISAKEEGVDCVISEEEELEKVEEEEDEEGQLDGGG